MNSHCPRCGSDRLRHSRRRTKFDYAMALAGGRFRRCHKCQCRFLLLGTMFIPAERLERLPRKLAFAAVMIAALLAVLCIPFLDHQ